MLITVLTFKNNSLYLKKLRLFSNTSDHCHRHFYPFWCYKGMYQMDIEYGFNDITKACKVHPAMLTFGIDNKTMLIL